MYVDMKFDYGIAERGKNYIGLDGFRASMESLGHSVIDFFYDSYLNNIDKLQDDILKFAEDKQPDLIFFCLYQNQFTHNTLRELKKKFKTVNWFGDDQWRFDSFTKFYANDFSWCITTDLYAIEKYHSIGQSNVIYSQWAAIDNHLDLFLLDDTLVNDTYDFEVSFVGGYHPYRKWFIDELEKNGVKVEAFGNGWPNGSLTAIEMIKLFQKSKINLNISNSISADLRYLLSSRNAFFSLFRIVAGNGAKIASQIKARNFEIPFFGGFQITDYVPSLERYFGIGEEIVCYTTPKDAITQIHYYLQNEEERENIKMRGIQRARMNHGYIHRFKKIFEDFL